MNKVLLAEAGSWAPSIGAPHPPQNIAPSLFRFPHFVQILSAILLPASRSRVPAGLPSTVLTHTVGVSLEWENVITPFNSLKPGFPVEYGARTADQTASNRRSWSPRRMKSPGRSSRSLSTWI